MRIEKNWEDCFVYFVGLEIPASPHRNKWFSNRTIILKNELNFFEVENLIKNTFGPEVKLVSVDLWDEGMVLKS